MKRLFEKYRGDLSGLFWLGLAIFLGASLASYSPQDPSLNSMMAKTNPSNLCGYLGSFLADVLYQGFGLPAWVLIFGCGRRAFFHFRGKLPRKSEPANWWMDILLLVTITSLLSLHLGDLRFFQGQIRIGGWVGYALTRSMIMAVNQVGLAILLWTGLAALLIFYTDRTWSEIVQRPRERISDTISIWWSKMKATVAYLMRPAAPRLVTAGAATITNASGTQTFFKITPDSSKSRVQQFDDDDQAVDESETLLSKAFKSSDPGPETESEADDEDIDSSTPITGFLKEQFGITKPK
jgi:DNA segregation ATPase FtsK/SpoIIIE, S-DNA-T family